MTGLKSLSYKAALLTHEPVQRIEQCSGANVKKHDQKTATRKQPVVMQALRSMHWAICKRHTYMHKQPPFYGSPAPKAIGRIYT